MTPGAITRRNMLAAMAGGAVAMSGIAPAAALTPVPVRDARINKLIGQASHLPSIAMRVAFISHALLGSPYRAHTLVGGPRRPERLVVRDDVFDCVTFLETVLAAARSRDTSQLPSQLRLIRYRDGSVEWHARNHYFADWCANNIANKVCRPLALPGSTTVNKRLTSEPGLPPHRVAMTALPVGALFEHKLLLATGDIIGFMSRRPGLDYFHSGFIVVDDAGGLWLRHAAESRGRALDQPLPRFLRDNRTQAVTLLRVREPVPGPVLI
ncbi:N-acetylmuramoyl-L-alanine amidase-like domain-containing protein [Pseudolabrys sp. Root1462]|uniref:N-acetylmuramoyl-L-alanine amidase-like domain-containing protein n=1 Tax=Pseudolabrys sp. Root1462 TaxID=1736466 RepID=UPI0009EC498E|nr:N-acetylmuramoyl-L-alanine amidase-like domain-containing protein [Pseudolabrys sp. Root1462]